MGMGAKENIAENQNYFHFKISSKDKKIIKNHEPGGILQT